LLSPAEHLGMENVLIMTSQTFLCHPSTINYSDSHVKVGWKWKLWPNWDKFKVFLGAQKLCRCYHMRDKQNTSRRTAVERLHLHVGNTTGDLERSQIRTFSKRNSIIVILKPNKLSFASSNGIKTPEKFIDCSKFFAHWNNSIQLSLKTHATLKWDQYTNFFSWCQTHAWKLIWVDIIKRDSFYDTQRQPIHTNKKG
jgi:hypothetical protein